MKAKTLFLIFSFMFSISTYSQTYYPNLVSQTEKNLKITRIEKNPTNTRVDFEYTTTESRGIYIFLSPPNTYGAYYIKANGIKFSLTDTEGIGNKDGITAAPPNKTIKFSAYFEPIPKSIERIDLIEGASGTWNFYGVELANNTNKAVSKQTVSYSLTLTSEGKLKNKGDALGDILYRIPAGTSVGIYSKENGYYKVKHNGTVGYLSELYFGNNNSSSKQISYAAKKNPVQKKEIKSYFKDGKTFQYYVHNGISVTMHLSIENSYGKYYIAYVALENLTGNSFNFNPNNITAIFVKNGEESSGEVLSSNDYMTKINRRQAWNAALVAFGESSAANQAGYSSSSTTSTTTGYANSYGSASGYYGNTYGSVYGNSTTYGTATTRSNTQSYNGASAYAARQNAQNNISNFQNQQYQIRNVLNQGYLKLNTINNEERIVGQINIKYQNADKIKITIPVNGNDYEFWWGN
ncbi:MAG: hypothetical protein AB7U05_18370 [Mangrovibacterium sp.]